MSGKQPIIPIKIQNKWSDNVIEICPDDIQILYSWHAFKFVFFKDRFQWIEGSTHLEPGKHMQVQKIIKEAKIIADFSPQRVKLLLMSLTQFVEQYEKTYGEINIPTNEVKKVPEGFI